DAARHGVLGPLEDEANTDTGERRVHPGVQGAVAIAVEEHRCLDDSGGLDREYPIRAGIAAGESRGAGDDREEGDAPGCAHQFTRSPRRQNRPSLRCTSTLPKFGFASSGTVVSPVPPVVVVAREGSTSTSARSRRPSSDSTTLTPSSTNEKG